MIICDENPNREEVEKAMASLIKSPIVPERFIHIHIDPSGKAQVIRSEGEYGN